MFQKLLLIFVLLCSWNLHGESKFQEFESPRNSKEQIFHRSLFKIIDLTSSIQNEEVRVSITHQLTSIGMKFLTATTLEDFDEFRETLITLSENIDEIFSDVNDRELAMNISSTLNEICLLFKNNSTF